MSRLRGQDGRCGWTRRGSLSSNPFDSIAGGAFAYLDARIEEELEDGLDLWNTDVPVLTPVISVNADDQQLGQVRMLREHAPRQVVLRGQHASRNGTADRIARIVRGLGVSSDEVHLILDEQYVEHVDERRVRELVDVVDDVSQRFELASIVLMAGSAPNQRKDLETRFRDRAELSLWRAVSERCSHPIRYGDYGVVHPLPTGEGGFGWPNPYIHCTVPNRSLFIGRKIPNRKNSVPPPGSSERYFLEVADELVHHEEYAGPRFSWGDRALHECRYRNTHSVGEPPTWIEIATSHHLAHLDHARDSATH